jgi:hypothetical protein
VQLERQATTSRLGENVAAELATLSLNCFDRFISMCEPPVSLAILVSLDVDLPKFCIVNALIY